MEEVASTVIAMSDSEDGPEEEMGLLSSLQPEAFSSTAFHPLKLCVFVEPSPFTYISGYANRFQALFDCLATEDDIDVTTVETVHPNPPHSWTVTQNGRQATFPIHYTRGMTCPGYSMLSISSALDWTLQVPRRLLGRNRPELIHVSAPGIMSLRALFWARVLQIPIVCSYHTHLPPYLQSRLSPNCPRLIANILNGLVWWVMRSVLSWADLVVVTSPQIQEEFQQHHIPRCHLWKKGIDTEKFNPKHRDASMRRRMLGLSPEEDPQGKSDKAFLMLCVGRLASEKRLHDLPPLLDVMPSNARMCIVGSGPVEDELRKQFQECRRPNDVVFMGALHGEELSQAFASADAFVMPSDSETLGFVVLESMASGVPVVASRAGGIPDIIKEDETGFLVEPGNTAEFAARLKHLQRHPELRRNVGRLARQDLRPHSWQSSMQHLRQVHYPEAWRNFSRRPMQRFWRFMTFQWGKPTPPHWCQPHEELGELEAGDAHEDEESPLASVTTAASSNPDLAVAAMQQQGGDAGPWSAGNVAGRSRVTVTTQTLPQCARLTGGGSSEDWKNQ